VPNVYNPENLANWFYKKIKLWSRTLAKGHATTHLFRKTSLQFVRCDEDINRRIAQDARVSETVLTNHYIQEQDEELQTAATEPTSVYSPAWIPPWLGVTGMPRNRQRIRRRFCSKQSRRRIG
jgi:hypothetical protein